MGRPLVFALNGVRVELAEVDPHMTLLTYIRSETNLQGTKLSCGEGGCGACTVLLSKYDPEEKSVEELTINACLAPLCSLDGCAITTTEGIKTKSGKEFHAVHKRLAGFHGSQCGFCTPGMAMSIYGGLRKAGAKAKCQNGASEVANSGSHCGVAPNLSALEAEKCVSGNICRCTGYRPILDACKSFSGEIDVEDLGVNIFWSSKNEANRDLIPAYDPEEDPQFPSFLITELEARLAASKTSTTEQSNGTHPKSGPLLFKVVEGPETAYERVWRTATSLAEVFDLFDEYRSTDLQLKLVVSNTSAGVYKGNRPQVYVDISGIPELNAVAVGKDSVHVGAGVSITKLIDILDAESKQDKNKPETENVVFKELSKHLQQVASTQLRNRASLGGNLVMAQKLGFDSDVATIMLGAGAQVVLASQKGQKSLSLEEFLSQPTDPEAVLVSVRIPNWCEESAAARSGAGRFLFKTFRVSVRPSGNAVSYINAALLAILHGEQNGALAIKDLRLAFGAFGGPHAIRAVETEKFLTGKTLSPQLILDAIQCLKKDITPTKDVTKSEYRTSVGVGFLFEFFKPFVVPESGDNEGHVSPTPLTNGTVVEAKANGVSHESVTDEEANRLQHFEYGSKLLKGQSAPRQVQGRQKFAVSSQFWPVAQPTIKAGAEIQAAGEAVYVDDIRGTKDTLYAVYVLSEKALAKIISIDTTQALSAPGAVAFVGPKDIPGKNEAFNYWGLCESLFAEDTVHYVGQPLGLLIADSQEHAKEAAAKVKINYEEEGEPIFTIEDAIAKESFAKDYPFRPDNRTVGVAPVKSDHRIENAEVETGSQYHFYMEHQTVYAIPDEDGCMTVYSPSQWPEAVQLAIATCLNVPMNGVRCICRRIGGAFGGKFTRTCMHSVACALAAFKLQRPVRIYLDKQTDILMCPGRHETKSVYTVDFNNDGKVTGLDLKVYLNGGQVKDATGFVAGAIGKTVGQYDWGYLNVEAKVCLTNQKSRSIMRSPGEAQGHFIAETIIEHVASYLGIDAHKVREKNRHSVESLQSFFPGGQISADSYTLPRLWEQAKESSHFHERQLAVQRFNETSKWVKKGIDIVPCLYNTGLITKNAKVSIFNDASIAVEVGGIEMGQGLFTKVRQTTAYGLSKLWTEKSDPSEGVDISKVRVVQNDTLSLPNGSVTGGSTGSEMSCAAVLQACELLVQRLKPLIPVVQQNLKTTVVTWQAICSLAAMYEVDRVALGHFPAGHGAGYLNYGVCTSEVAIDVLKGTTTILQTDLVYDCGRSLNPAIDIGQIEGAFVQGIGFYLTEKFDVDGKTGKVLTTGTWDYKPPVVDNIPQKFHVELLNSISHKDRILSSKASGEPPLLLAKSVHSAVRNAIEAARADIPPKAAAAHKSNGSRYFQLDAPAYLDIVKSLCGYDNVEKFLSSLH